MKFNLSVFPEQPWLDKLQKQIKLILVGILQKQKLNFLWMKERGKKLAKLFLKKKNFYAIRFFTPNFDNNGFSICTRKQISISKKI